MSLKKAIQYTGIVILALALYSMLPLGWFYFVKKDVLPPKNEQLLEEIKKNKGNYYEFIVLGDCHSGLLFDDSASIRLADKINHERRYEKIPIDFVIISGDVTFRGSDWDYKNFNKFRSLIRWPVLSAFGNHDDDNGGEERFNKYVGVKEFSFKDRNSYFIVINNSSGDLTETQFEKLESDLNEAQAYKHRFVILHKAPMSIYQQSWYRPETSSWSYRFMKLCEKYNVTMVFSGHEHMYVTGIYGGVRYIVSGGGGIITKAPEADGGYLHYVVVRIYKDYIDYEVRKVYPPFWQYITYYMWKNLVYFVRDRIL
jgi:hypothetical protein